MLCVDVVAHKDSLKFPLIGERFQAIDTLRIRRHVSTWVQLVPRHFIAEQVHLAVAADLREVEQLFVAQQGSVEVRHDAFGSVAARLEVDSQNLERSSLIAARVERNSTLQVALHLSRRLDRSPLEARDRINAADLADETTFDFHCFRR